MKNKRKVKVFFTMDTEVNDEFEKHIEDNLLDKSKLIEFIIKKYLEDKNIQKIKMDNPHGYYELEFDEWLDSRVKRTFLSTTYIL